MYERLMDMGNGVGMDCGSGRQAGWSRAMGKNWDNCNIINKNKKTTNSTKDLK